MNSFILTPHGIALLLAGKAYNVDSSHINYDRVIDAVRSKRFDSIPALLDLRTELTKKFEGSELTISDSGVTFRGHTLNGEIQKRILEMFQAGFDLSPMSQFLTRLYLNPSKKSVDELFGWISANGITISEDGFLYAYKRVQDDFTSFADSKTRNDVGTYVQMLRNEVDDRSDRTCSTGLHFCAQTYLPHYAGGSGQVLLLKIDPADVVSIPTDYKFAKGRACRYFVEANLTGDSREKVEKADVLKQSVVRAAEDVNQTNTYKAAYKLGYKDGRGKQKKFKSIGSASRSRPNKSELDGYLTGYAEGRAKQPKRFI